MKSNLFGAIYLKGLILHLISNKTDIDQWNMYLLYVKFRQYIVVFIVFC